MSAPAPNGAYILWPLNATKSAARGSGRWGGELGGIDDHRDAALVRAGDDRLERWQPARDIRRPGHRQQPRSRLGVERVEHRLGLEGPVRAALDEPAPGDAPPGQHVRVVLHHSRDYDVRGIEPQAIGEVVDRLGGVAQMIATSSLPACRAKERIASRACS
jgi:hypothetical protein